MKLDLAATFPGTSRPVGDVLLDKGDYYLHLADLKSYLDADARLTDLYLQRHGWAKMAILNIAGSGEFSSDRTIAQYAADIWRAVPCSPG